MIIVRGTIEGELALEMSSLNATIVSLQTQVQLQDRKVTAAEARGNLSLYISLSFPSLYIARSSLCIYLYFPFFSVSLSLIFSLFLSLSIFPLSLSLSLSLYLPLSPSLSHYSTLQLYFLLSSHYAIALHFILSIIKYFTLIT